MRTGRFGDHPYSAIHKAAGSLVTGRSQKYWRQERPPEAIPPLMASRMEWWNGGIVPGKSGNREAGGFVNSAVRCLYRGMDPVLSSYSAIHKATGLHHHSTIPSLKPSMGEWSLGVVPASGFFGNGQ